MVQRGVSSSLIPSHDQLRDVGACRQKEVASCQDGCSSLQEPGSPKPHRVVPSRALPRHAPTRQQGRMQGTAMQLEPTLDSNRPPCRMHRLGSFVIIQLFGNLGIGFLELDEGPAGRNTGVCHGLLLSWPCWWLSLLAPLPKW